MDQQNQINQPNNSQKSQQNFKSNKFEKVTVLHTWVAILIVVMAIIAIIIAGLVSYDTYQYFTFQPKKPELPAKLDSPVMTEKKLVEIPKKTILEHPDIEYPDFSIFYDYDDQIWQFNPKTEAKKKIANGIRAAISPDKTKIAYTYQGWNKHFEPSEDNLTGIHIFNIATGKDKLLKQYDKNYPIWETDWSPDGKYIIIDMGTSPVRGKVVINSSTGKNIISFTTYHGSYAWENTNEIVFSDLQNITEQRPYGGGDGAGIAIINLDGQKKVLKTATDKKDYSLIQLIDNKIYFLLRTVESNEDWTNEANQSISYWTMDKFGNNLTKIEMTETKNLKDKIKKLLPSPYNEYKSLWHATSLIHNKDWVIFVLNKRGKTGLEDEIFIMNINNHESIKKIGDGRYPIW